MMDNYFIGEIAVVAVSAVIAWFAGRRQQKVEARRMEVEVLEKAIQVINRDVIAPLEAHFEKALNELSEMKSTCEKLRHAINKMYNCGSLPSCPVDAELRRQKDGQPESAEPDCKPYRQHKRRKAKGNKAPDGTALEGGA
jgi:hypothetical protein